MKKEYERPAFFVHPVTAREIIVTSVITGGDEADDTSVEAPPRDNDWSNYYN